MWDEEQVCPGDILYYRPTTHCDTHWNEQPVPGDPQERLAQANQHGQEVASHKGMSLKYLFRNP